MELKIHAVGGVFGEASGLRGVVDLLHNYDVAFDQSLKRACVASGVPPASVDVRLKVARPGTLSVELVTEVAAAVAPLAPQIFGFAWQLYKSAYDLIMIVTKRFKETGHPMEIQVIDSPNAVVNMINIGAVRTTEDVLEVAKSIHPFLDKIAQLIKGKRAENISLESDLEDAEVLEFSRRNQDDFHLPEADILEGDSLELECEIYRFNKRTLNGNLQYEEDDRTVLKPFTLDPDLLNECLEAIKSPSITATVFREMTTNALGETKIKRFHIVGIKIHEI